MTTPQTPPAPGGQGTDPPTQQPATPQAQPPDPAPAPGAAPPAPATPAQDPGPEPERLEFTKDAFKKRLEQHERTTVAGLLKTLGFEDLEAVKAFKQQADEAASAAEEARRAELSELERTKAEIADRDAKISELESAKTAAEEAAEAARVEVHLRSLLSSKGIANTDYAFFRLERKLNSLPDGEDLDEAAYLDELLADPREKFALGVSGAETPATPVSTVTPDQGPNPTPPQATPPKNVRDMSEDEWRAYKKSLTS